MTKPARSSLDDLAARIDESQPIDWARESELAPDEESRRIISGLQLVAEVAQIVRDPVRLARAESAGRAAVQPAPAVGRGTPWGELTVFEIIGRGAFGTVYRATDALGRTVALKLLDPGLDGAALRTRIIEEGRLLARVRHPNIVLVHGAVEFDGRVGLWMEYVDGRTLAAEVDAQGTLSAEEAALIGRKLCDTLVAIHAQGVVHADVKAQNVMRARAGRIVLMDFGAGQALVGANPKRLAGTPLYLAPERLAGGPLTPSCDIYALGVLLYYLVTGAYPVEGDTRDDVERAHREGRRTRLRDRRPDLPDAFVAAVEQAIETDPAQRPATAGALDAALARVVSPDATRSEPGPETPSPRPPRPAGDRWPWWLLMASVPIVMAVAIAWMLSDPPAAPRGIARLSSVASAAETSPEGTYAVRAAFYEVTKTGRQPVRSGMHVRPGVMLELDLQLSGPSYVYVVNEDERGAPSLLFPLPGGSLQNPLRGGQAHTLPGPRAKEPVQWEVSSVGGREHFFVIVSPDPLPADIEKAINQLVPASDDPALSVRAGEAGGMRGVRGVNRLAHRKPVPPRSAWPWWGTALPLTDAEEHPRGLWVRQLTLENPGRGGS